MRHRQTTVDPADLQLDPDLRMPYTDQYSIGLDREVGARLVVSAAYIRKDGRDFIGWEGVTGTVQYDEQTVQLPDNQEVQVFKLTSPPNERRYRLTNPDGYLLTYDGLLIAVEKRRSNGWQAFGSYTLSKAYGLQPSSGTTADGAQVATVGSPPAAFASPVTFGRDPNDLTNALGRLPNDRPHMARMMISADVPRTGFVLAANLQYSDRQAVGGDRARQPSAGRPAAHPARTARIASASVADPARHPHLESVPARRPGADRSACRCAQCPQRHGRGERPDGCEIRSGVRSAGPTPSWIRAARCSASS